MEKLRIAIQKSGRLSEKSLELLSECGIKVTNGGRTLLAQSTNFPIEIIYLRDDDIPGVVSDGVADAGILGLDVLEEKDRNLTIVHKLGFARCRLSIAIPKAETWTGLDWLNGKKIATSYPVILDKFLAANNIQASIHEICGSVEIGPGIGLSEAILDVVSSGSTLVTNGLKECVQVMNSEAVVVSASELCEEKKQILENLLFRIRAVLNARENKYILLNAPNEKLDEIISIVPGIKSPTVIPLAASGWSAVHSVMKEDEFWDVINRLKEAGAQGILVVPVEKMIY